MIPYLSEEQKYKLEHGLLDVELLTILVRFGLTYLLMQYYNSMGYEDYKRYYMCFKIVTSSRLTLSEMARNLKEYNNNILFYQALVELKWHDKAAFLAISNDISLDYSYLQKYGYKLLVPNIIEGNYTFVDSYFRRNFKLPPEWVIQQAFEASKVDFTFKREIITENKTINCVYQLLQSCHKLRHIIIDISLQEEEEENIRTILTKILKTCNCAKVVDRLPEKKDAYYLFLLPTSEDYKIPVETSNYYLAGYVNEHLQPTILNGTVWTTLDTNHVPNNKNVIVTLYIFKEIELTK